MENLLVLRGGALGDFIVTLPALALLRARWPNARIELAGNATAAQLALHRGLIDAVHSQHEARWAALYDDAPLPQEFGEWLDAFDLVISFWPDPDGELRRRFPRHHRQTFLQGAPLPERNPAAAHYCEPLRTLGIEPRTYFHRLEPTMAPHIESAGVPAPAGSTERKLSASGASKYANRILVHPGSGSQKKNWPAANWRALITRLAVPTSLILGEAEQGTWPQASAVTAKQLGVSETLDLINAPLEHLVEAIASCRLFLGHDSGISHLAAATGAKCVLLFGPTEPACWAPPAPNVRVLRNRSDLASLSIEAVQSAVEAALSDQT